MTECKSSKSWYFLRVSGRNLSHLCVECALATHPTLVLISEEVEEKVTIDQFDFIGVVIGHIDDSLSFNNNKKNK